MIQTRIRSIKPEFFRHKGLNKLPPEYRLLFIGLWCMADRAGRLEYDADLIRVLVAPTLTVDAVAAGVEQLTADGYLQRYEADGREYLQVVRFGTHQRPDHREPKSQRPEPPNAPESQAGATPGERPGNARATPRWEGEREGEGEGSSPQMRQAGAEATATAVTASRDGSRTLFPQLPGARSSGGSERQLQAVPSPEQLLDAYHRLCSELPRVQEFHATRRRHAAARLREHPLSWWEGVFAQAARSPFLRGEAPPGPGRTRPFKADFDWFVANAANAVKVAEGKYTDEGSDGAGERRERRRL